MVTPDDAALVNRCLQGDVGAFGELIDRYERALYNTALRMTGDQEDAKDITQTAFIKAYENLRGYRDDHRFFSWLYRILVNETINAQKRRKQEQGLDADIAATGRTPDEELDANILSGRIEKGLRELTFEYRVVIVLRYFNDMSYQEMSEILSVPEKTVKSRLYTARQNLGVILERLGVRSL